MSTGGRQHRRINRSLVLVLTGIKGVKAVIDLSGGYLGGDLGAGCGGSLTRGPGRRGSSMITRKRPRRLCRQGQVYSSSIHWKLLIK